MHRVRPRHGPVRGYPEFDPDEPRDEHGRWGGGGTEGGEGGFHEVSASASKDFHSAISAAKTGKFASSVHVYKPAEYREMRVFLTPDRKAGFALKGDDIVSVFKHPDSTATRVANIALQQAVKMGGKRLDAFDTVLPDLYSKNGFRAVARLKWDDAHAPPGWDKNTYKKFNGGEPDVVFMVHDPANAKLYRAGDGKRVATYDQGVAEQEKALAKQHPGEGYSKHAWVDPKGVIHTSNVADAQRALYEHRKVELRQPKQVATLIRKLGQEAKRWQKEGQQAPLFNLCDVSVAGTNLFCAETKGIPRAEMPQMDDKQTRAFREYLKDRGYKVKKEEEFAANLRATQNELNGAKVAAVMDQMQDHPDHQSKRLIISSDDYILDGHHHWAGKLGLDAADGKLDNDAKMRIARVNIPIIKLLEEAEKFTGGKGKKPATETEFGKLLRLLRKAFDPSQPRDEQGRWTDEGGGDGGGGAVAAPSAPATEAEKPPAPGQVTEHPNYEPKPKKKSELSDFAKDDVRIEVDQTKQQKFLSRWNESINEAPAEFRNRFLGGIPGTMKIEYNDRDETFTINGNLQDQRGGNIAEYTRTIDFNRKQAASNYFKVRSGVQGHDVGKQMLAANVETYKALGMKKVTVYANIDVGGYAWARYGYVPTNSAWDQLSGQIERSITGGARVAGRGGRPDPRVETYTPTSWEELSDDQQENVFHAWLRSTADEFIDSEEESWRESGGPLDTAKGDLADNFDSDVEWANEAVQNWREQYSTTGPDEYDENEVPFTNKQILDAISVDYERDYEGRNDAEITFDDDKLTDPNVPNYSPEQQTLPGIEAVKPHEYLTQEMRDGIEKALSKAFDSQAEDDAGRMERPDYLAEQAREYQEEYWDQLGDRERFRQAERNGLLPEIEIEPEEEEEEEPKPAQLPLAPPAAPTSNDALLKLAQSDDPKAIWRIADSPRGKDLLLNTSWNGVLDLADKETMDRFDAYVHKKKAA